MDTNKMRDISREQFEASWRVRHPLHGDDVFKRSGLYPEDYCNTRTRDAWWAWQDSREAVVVTLPRITGHEYDPLADADYREGCREAIEAHGLKVAP